MNQDDDQPPRRSDVGYGRPPAEHQFKKGQKPPPRKRRKKPQESAQVVLWRILKELKRVEINGKPMWLPMSEIIMRKAFMLADEGHPSIQRLLTDIALANAEDDEEAQPRIETNPDHEEASVWTERRRLD